MNHSRLLLKSGLTIFAASFLIFALGCRQDMARKGRIKPLEPSEFFEDNQSARPIVPNTVPRGYLRADKHFYTGMTDGRLADSFPLEITHEVLELGQERFNIFCSVCHGRTGYGDGMIVQRGFRPPPSFHSERLRNAPVGHFFSVITSGFGVMYSYAYRIPPKDRWAIIAYIRTLQLSQNATLADVPQEQRYKLRGKKPESRSQKPEEKDF